MLARRVQSRPYEQSSRNDDTHDEHDKKDISALPAIGLFFFCVLILGARSDSRAGAEFEAYPVINIRMDAGSQEILNHDAHSVSVHMLSDDDMPKDQMAILPSTMQASKSIASLQSNMDRFSSRARHKNNDKVFLGKASRLDQDSAKIHGTLGLWSAISSTPSANFHVKGTGVDSVFNASGMDAAANEETSSPTFEMTLSSHSDMPLFDLANTSEKLQALVFEATSPMFASIIFAATVSLSLFCCMWMPAAPVSKQGSAGATSCVVCLDALATATLLHGRTGHTACCISCAKELQKKHGKCPICREYIDDIVIVYSA